jgi:hypothetical protein
VIVVRSIGKYALAVAVLTVMLSLLPGAGQAGAAEPWWSVTTISAPASEVGGEASIVVDISNLGDGPAGGSLAENLSSGNDPITIVDKLPAGVAATMVHAGGGGGTLQAYTRQFPSLAACSIVGETVRCGYGVPVLPYEHILIVITVKVAPGAGRGENEVSVSGGGPAPADARRQLALEAPAPPFGVQTYRLTPEEENGLPDTQAGSHPFQLTTTLIPNTQTTPVFTGQDSSGEVQEIQPVALTKDLRFNLPPGLVGNPTPLPKCSLYEFTLILRGTGHCPADTVVGVATPILAPLGLSPYIPYVISEPLYSLEPSVGEPAKFGFVTPVGPVILDTSVRTGGDYGVVVTVSNLTQAAAFIGNQVTFWGVPNDSRHDDSRSSACLNNAETYLLTGQEASCPVDERVQPFLIMPTSCTGPLRTSVEADSWRQPGQFIAPMEYAFQNDAGEPSQQDGCNRLNFEPSIGVTPDGQAASTPTGLTVNVHVPQGGSLNPLGLSEANVKDTTVTLPEGVALNPSGADGLSSCGQGEIGLESPAEQRCPESSKVGTVEIKTPLLPNPLTGAAYLASQNANPFGSLVALYIVARDPVSGVIVKIAGQVTLDPVTGQLVSTFQNTPQLPFEDLYVNFFGGSRAPLGTPALCGSYTTKASIAPWSGNAPVESSSEFQITTGPNGSSCSDPLPFKPTLTAGTTSIQAGGFSPFRMTMGREDGQQSLQSVQLHMPPGLSGTLSSVKLCGEAQADAGTCGPESLIGHTIVSVGLGGNPYSVTGGEVFITGPHDGAPYGLSIVNPAKAGPFNLGNVVVRAKIEVDPTTAALTITTDPSGPYAIPQIIDGVPLQIKHVNVTIDRPDFTFNPTNCSPLAITGSLGSSEGSSLALSVPFQVTNCAVLAFKPKLTASTAGKTSKAGGASLTVKLGYPAGPYDANIARVKVELPKALPSRLTTLQKACKAETFEANPAACPAASIVGHATATTPVLPVPLTGPAYFVSHGGEAFPSLIIVLQGYGATVHLVGSTFISKAGVTSSTFKTIPDVPVGAFELTLPQGQFSALAANVNLCKAKGLAMPTEFVGQNGAEIHTSTKIAVTGCPKAKKATRKRKAKKRGGERKAAKGKRGKR